jgi:hypothetical protein
LRNGRPDPRGCRLRATGRIEMHGLIKRLERLEAVATPENAPRVVVQFVGSGAWSPTRAWCRGEGDAITRRASELPEAFEERALAHFAGIDPAPSPLVVLFN